MTPPSGDRASAAPGLPTGRVSDLRRLDLDQWSSAEKSTVVSLVVVGLVLYSTFLLRYAAAYPAEVPFVDPAVLLVQLRLSYIVLALWLLLGVASFLARRKYGSSRFFENAPVQLFSISNSFFAYLMGSVTVPYGSVVLIGGILAALPLFGRRATFLGMMSWGVITVTLLLFGQYGLIPYGPLFHGSPVADGHLSSLWLAGVGSITLMGIGVCAAVSILVINQLRARDQRLRSSEQQLLAAVEKLHQSYTEIRRSHEELEERVDARTRELRVVVAELERANGLKSEFVATMSHELRTPVSIILGYSDLLLDDAFGPLAADQTDVILRLARNATSLFELVNATLDLSRLEAGTMGLELRVVGVSQLLAEVVEAQEDPPIGVSFLCEEASNLGKIRTDPGKLKVILRNLVSNAFKFTERGSVTLSTVGLKDGIEFSVRDTGPGIAAEMHEVIFEAFRQGDGSPSRVYGGAGLGLHIVRQLAEMLGGEVLLESREGEGAVFRLWIPASCPVATRDSYRGAESRLAQTGAASPGLIRTDPASRT
jgi:signal transduction histidine kinase